MVLTRMVISLVLFSIAAVIFVFTMPKRKADPSNVVFTNRVTSDDLPNSVVFSYDVGENKVDSVIIQQSWDPSTPGARVGRKPSAYLTILLSGFF